MEKEMVAADVEAQTTEKQEAPLSIFKKSNRPVTLKVIIFKYVDN